MVADVNEEWITPIDTQMAKLGDVVLRAKKQDLEYELEAREIIQ
jgi:hypothetical protein